MFNVQLELRLNTSVLQAHAMDVLFRLPFCTSTTLILLTRPLCTENSNQIDGSKSNDNDGQECLHHESN